MENGKIITVDEVRGFFEDAARELGLAAGSTLDEHGACTIVSSVRGMPEICFAFDAEGSCADLFAEIAVIPEDRPDLLKDFLCNNLFRHETRGAVFALERERNLLVYQRLIDFRTVEGANALAEILSDFAEIAYAAKQHVFKPVESAAVDGEWMSVRV